MIPPPLSLDSPHLLRKSQIKYLKVPKCEIFDRSDCHDFYPIKSLWEGDFGVKIKCLKQIFMGSFGAAKFLTCMLSLILRDFF